MNRRFMFAAIAAVALAGAVSAQVSSDPAVLVTHPSPWATLRSDSVTVSLQADASKLPQGSVDLRLVKRSGGRSSVLSTKSVKIGDSGAADVFLGRVGDAPLGGRDFLSVEWSVPGTGLKDTVEPVGVVRLNGEISADNVWIPARPPLTAVRLTDGTAAGRELASSSSGFKAGGIEMAAGWNAEGLFILFTPAGGVTGVEFAFDLKCGKNAFLAWADRFIRYSADGGVVRGLHYGNRETGKDGIVYGERAWGGSQTLSVSEAGTARLVRVSWHELGIQPFDGRNVGFAVFAQGRGSGQPSAYPAGAKRDIPGTWGEINLAK